MLKYPESVRASVTARYGRHRGAWLLGDTPWPISESLGTPTERDALADLDAVRAWITAWRKWPGPGHVTWSEKRWKAVGAQELPQTLLLSTPGEAAAVAGEGAAWHRASARFNKLVSRWPLLIAAMSRRFDVLAGYTDPDFLRLEDVLDWLLRNPASGLYVRQLPIGGMDTKWIGARAGLISELLKVLRPSNNDAGDLHTIAGLIRPADRLRMRVLCPELRQEVGNLEDVQAPVGDLATLAWKVGRVFIVENLESGLAIEPMPHTVVFFGRGYAVDAITQLPWVHQARCYYWGDIDTHGFACLNRARSKISELQSILMDKATLMLNVDLCVPEPAQHASDKGESLSSLTPSEREVFDGLKSDLWGPHLRLEQERIPWNQVRSAMNSAE